MVDLQQWKVATIADQLLANGIGEIPGDFSVEMCAALDELVQKCTCCDWWVETDEIDDIGWCEDCQEAAES